MVSLDTFSLSDFFHIDMSGKTEAFVRLNSEGNAMDGDSH